MITIDLLGYSFYDEKIHLNKNDKWETCYKIESMEVLFHEVVKKLSKQYGLNGSLHDLPKIFSNGLNGGISWIRIIIRIERHSLMMRPLRSNCDIIIFQVSHFFGYARQCYSVTTTRIA